MKLHFILSISLTCISFLNSCEVKQCGNKLCNINSFCLNNEVCLCPPNFVTAQGNSHCCYEQKRQMKAFLLEFFVSFGAGHFYAGRRDMGIAKVLVFCLLIGVNLFLFGVLNCYKWTWKHLKFLQRLCHYSTIACFLIWQIIDLSYYGKNEYTDENGIRLASW